MIVDLAIQRPIEWPDQTGRETLKEVHQQAADQKDVAEKELHDEKSLQRTSQRPALRDAG